MDLDTLRRKIEEAEWFAPELLDSRVAELLSYIPVELSAQFVEGIGTMLAENNGKLTTQNVFEILKMITQEPMDVEDMLDEEKIVTTDKSYYV